MTAIKTEVPHEMVPSKLGRGEMMCVWCRGTNKELGVLGVLKHCETRATMDPKFNAGAIHETSRWEANMDTTTIKELVRRMAATKTAMAEFAIGPMIVSVVVSPIPKHARLRDAICAVMGEANG